MSEGTVCRVNKP